MEWEEFLDGDLPEVTVQSRERVILSDQRVRNLCRAFYEKFPTHVSKLRDAPERFPPHVYRAFKKWGLHRTRDIKPEILQISGDIELRISEVAGHKFSFREIVHDALWKPAERLIEADAVLDADQLCRDFLTAVTTRIGYQAKYRGGCYLFASSLYRERLDVGPLRIAVGVNIEWAGSEYEELNNRAIQTEPPSKYSSALAPATWVIRLPASHLGFRQAMRWYVDIFTSLLRFDGVRFLNPPQVGYVEADPFVYQEHISGGAQITDGDSCHLGAGQQVFYYSLTEEGVEDIRNARFQERYALLINADKGSAGDRLAHAFAWMSRARRQRDQEIRLLFFFTAMETLLSASAEQGAAVSDSIARGASVLLASEPVERANTFRFIKQLYGLRSKVVHRGESHIYEADTNRVQLLAEQIAGRFLETVDLNEKHETVRRKLAEASFGLPWDGEGRTDPPANDQGGGAVQ